MPTLSARGGCRAARATGKDDEPIHLAILKSRSRVILPVLANCATPHWQASRLALLAKRVLWREGLASGTTNLAAGGGNKFGRAFAEQFFRNLLAERSRVSSSG